MAIIIGLLKNASALRNLVIIVGGFVIMAAAIYVAVTVLISGDTSQFVYLQETHLPDMFVIGGEIFLMCLVCFLSIKYKKYYAIVFS
ncbi:MAG: NADH-quinone oxidoreductase subunit L, partial [Butyrivibrio sp.]|nr:NADH-quinone oxidoreductase subunit L [Butyrivibrio sp.]